MDNVKYLYVIVYWGRCIANECFDATLKFIQTTVNGYVVNIILDIRGFKAFGPKQSE